MTIRRTIITAAAALAAAALLAGCSGSNDPKPAKTTASSHTATASATPTPTAVVAPAQAQVAAPTSKDAALQAANKTVQKFIKLQFDLESNPSLGASYLNEYVSGNASGAAPSAVEQLQKAGLRLTGSPSTFQPDMGISYTSTVTAAAPKKTQYPFANAMLIGCLSNLGTGQKYIAKGGATPPALKLQSEPFEYQVMYSPDQKVWKVTAFQPADPNSGAVPEC